MPGPLRPGSTPTGSAFPALNNTIVDNYKHLGRSHKTHFRCTQEKIEASLIRMRRLADETVYMSPKVSKQRQLSLLFLSGIMEVTVILEAGCISTTDSRSAGNY